jgi:predicted branched-subunit amino acid permease
MNVIRPYAHGLWLGFRAMLPFMLTAAPVAITFTISAQQAGLSPVEIQLMSLTMYSSSAQLATVQLLTSGASVFTMVLMVMSLNIHHLLYGLSLEKSIEFSRLKRFVAAYFLTDVTYALTIERKARFSFLLGAELSMFIAWNLFTALGLLMGQLLVAVSSAHLDFVVPLSFFLLLVSSVKTRTGLNVAVFSACATALCLFVQLGSLTIILVGLAGAFMGAAMSERQRLAVKPS